MRTASGSPSPSSPGQDDAHDATPWRLHADLILRVLQFLPPNDLACSGRLSCKDAAASFASAQHLTVRLSLPLPQHSVQTFVLHTQQVVRQLPYHCQLRLLSSAATTGCEANLDAAWALVQPCLFPELLPTFYGSFYGAWYDCGLDPGTAAVQAGHAHVLESLVRRRWPLHVSDCLAEAARHCDLGTLQGTWQLLRHGVDAGLQVDGEVLAAAAASCTPDAQAKVEWLLDTAGREEQLAGDGAGSSSSSSNNDSLLTAEVAAGAARAGNLGLLRWLHDRGCPVDSCTVLAAALQHAPGMEVPQWLVGGAGCALPDPSSPEGVEGCRLLTCGAAGSGHVARLRWLQDRGVGLQGGELAQAALHGKLEVARYLHEECGQALEPDVMCRAVASGSWELLRWLEAKRRWGTFAEFTPAFGSGDLELVEWVLGRNLELTTSRYRPLARVAAREWPLGKSCLPLLQLLQGYNIKWYNAMPLHLVAERGDVELVRCILSQGLLLSMELLQYAAMGGCEDMVDVVVRQGYDVEYGTWWYVVGEERHALDPYVAAGKNGDRGTMECLRSHGVPVRCGLVEAVRAGCTLPVLQWLVEQGLVADREAVEAALREAENGDVVEELVVWLRDLAGMDPGGSCRPTGV